MPGQSCFYNQTALLTVDFGPRRRPASSVEARWCLVHIRDAGHATHLFAYTVGGDPVGSECWTLWP